MRNIQRGNPDIDEYDRIESAAPSNGLLSSMEDPAGSAFESALAARRQKLASRKIGLKTQPGEADEQ